MDVRVTAVPERRRYEAEIDGEVVGYVNYLDGDGERRFLHAEVDPGVGGRGVGHELVVHALDDTRAQGLRIVPICSFVARVAREQTP